MNLSDIRQELYDHFGYGDTPSPDVERRIDSYINAAYFELMTRPGLGKLRQAIIPVVGVSGSPYTVLPSNVTRIRAIVNQTTMEPLYELNLQQQRLRDPGNQDGSGDPTHYSLLGGSALATDLSAAAELFVKSSSGSDTVVKVTIDGILSNGMPRRVGGMALTGTTGVSVDSTITTWQTISRFVLDSRALGDVTLHQGSGSGTELARIPKGKTQSRYTKLKLYPYPTSAVTLSADVVLSLDKMVDPTDEPLLPEDYHWLVVCGAMMRQHTKDGNHAAYAEEKARLKEGRGALFMDVTGPNGLGKGSRSPGFSQLGPNYPAGS